MLRKNKHTFFYNNGLSIVFITLTLFSLIGQVISGIHEYNNHLIENGLKSITLSNYLTSGHFLQATFENWESEFFQMGLFVWFTVFLRQQGSSESKPLNEKDRVDRKPRKHANAPWPVKKGGLMLLVYKHSLSLSLMLLFLISFFLHWYGSNIDFNENQIIKGKSPESMITYLANSRFWFESFQNWQSEFLSVFAIIFFSIYLREIGSPQSKPVDAPHFETGE